MADNESRNVDQIQFDRLEQSLEQITKALFMGNGHEALMSRVARSEEHYEAILNLEQGNAQCAKENIAAIEKLTIALTELKGSVDSHHKSMHVQQYISNAKFWILLFVGGGILHYIWTVAPGIWDNLAAWMKLPMWLFLKQLS
jgi:hypothetical protein